jgi:hypothetical protein
VCDGARYPVTMCSNFVAPQKRRKFPRDQTHHGESGSGFGTKKCSRPSLDSGRDG